MMNNAALVALLKQAGLAHHAAFAATNGEDEQWPQWYAAYLVPRLSGLLRRVPDVRVLAEDLRAVDIEQRSAQPALTWSEYYAPWFLAKYGTPAG